MGKREKLSEQTGSPSTPGETFLKAAGQYVWLEDDGFFINDESPASQGGGNDADVVQHYWPGCDGNRESPRS